MAVAPLFVVDMPTLLKRLKLEGASTPGSLAEIDQAVQQVRLGFYRRLGAARIAAIQATPYVDNPVTDSDYLAMSAVLVEVNWCRQILLGVKQTLFKDGSANALQLWNDEGAFGPNTPKSIAEEISRLSALIEDGLVALESGASTPPSAIQTAVTGPAATPDLPGATSFPGRRNPPYRGYWPFGWTGGRP